MKKSELLRIGFILNPVAGVGGPAGLKGSDAEKTRSAVFSGALPMRAHERAGQFFKALDLAEVKVNFFCIEGLMGSTLLDKVKAHYKIVDCSVKEECDREDTQIAIRAILNEGVDLLLFVGGDGTARDVCEVVARKQLCLGIPAGVKMQSGVFALHPVACAEIVAAIAGGKLTAVAEREVRDIDESGLQAGLVNSRHFGYLSVPESDEFVQQVKQGEGSGDHLLFADMAAEISETLEELEDENCLLIFGPGSTTYNIQQELSYAGTLLGVDVFDSEGLSRLDVNASGISQILSAHKGQVRLILTVIGGQGYVFGRGNQQIGPEAIRRIGKDNCYIVASQGKLLSLEGRPLIMDSGDSDLDKEWAGLLEVICGYKQRVLYALGAGN